MPSAVELEPAQQLDRFQELINGLSRTLGPSSGIDSEDVDPAELEALMRAYKSFEDEWEKYAFADTSRAFTRNLVDKGNGRSNLLVIVWTPGQCSPIHDHADSHCVMKVLQGSLKETRYDWPEEEGQPLNIKTEKIYGRNEVTYMSDQLGLHKIENADPNVRAVSLHLYTPPNAATYGCHIFNERDGSNSHVKQCSYFSEYGTKRC